MARVEKLMSISRSEFEAAWRTFDASAAPAAGAPARLPAGAGAVEIAFEPRSGVRLGGLLELPRAVVIFTFHGVDPEPRDRLIARFDRAFQRGGG